MADRKYSNKRSNNKKGSHSNKEESRRKPTAKRKTSATTSDEPKAMRKMKEVAAKEREEEIKKFSPAYKSKKESNNTNKKGKKKKGKHPKLMLALKIFIILFLLLCIVGAGVVAGTFFGLFGNDFEITKEQLTIAASNSVIVDVNDNIISNLSGDEKRKIITLEEMSDYLPKAYVAIEDERFYTHDGVDLKRTAGAIVGTLIRKTSYGGSTITQQLVKNLTKDDEVKGLAGISRKIKEWAKAYQVERMISKDQILELYLNILFVGGDIHGVELGSEYYFGKSAKDLDLAESAFLAGINNSPNSYNPYDKSVDNSEKIKKRTNIVLSKMKELGYIENEEEYNVAVAKVEAGIEFEKAEIASQNIYSYHSDAVISQVVTQVMNEKGISKELAQNYIYSSGLKIYSTVNTEIQSRLEVEYAKSKYQIKGTAKDKNGEKLNNHSQSGMAIIDYKTGQVAGVAGGLGEKNESRGWNRATQMLKQTGSVMKPLASVIPALEEKLITAATIYDDSSTDFGGGYKPKNYNRFMGLVNIREFIETSQNIPAIKIMAELTPTKSLTYLKKMGITTLNEKDDAVLSLAIGGMKNGISPLEMAAAYGTIANDGVYITPTFYTKIIDSSGNTVLTPKQETVKAMTPQNSYIAKTILQEPVVGSSGTARYTAIKGIDVAAKTGTTDEDFDRWLCGFTPYYSAACWYGYDNNETVRYGSSNPAGLIWSAVMSDVHKNLANASFVKPEGIVEHTTCRVTGCMGGSGCGDVYSEIFTQDNLPEKCEGHGSQKVCTESNLMATNYCPSTRTNYYGSTILKEKLKLWKSINGTTGSGSKITGVCGIHTKPIVTIPNNEAPKNNTNTNKADENITTNNVVKPDPVNNTNTNTNINTNTNTNTNTEP